MPLTILCIATYRKGDEFLKECRRQGCRVLLLTEEKLRDSDWPREAIDEFYFIRREMSEEDIRKGAAFVARTERYDRIVALDDFDVEMAAMLREHLLVPGMGQTAARAFRDKLTMRSRARQAGIPVPDFVHALNDAALREWTDRVPAPWVLKPRSQAAAIGIKKLASAVELRQALDALGDARADYLIEQFIPGDVYHVDSIVFDSQVRFATPSRYGAPPMSVAHEGGLFMTRTLGHDDPDCDPLLRLNAQLLGAFGLERGASHTEFIHAHDGRWFFLETSARVGGAYIVDVVEAATGINLWREWARTELVNSGGTYDLPPVQPAFAGIVLSLARQEYPDTSGYDDEEVVMRIRKRHHAGLIVRSPRAERVSELLARYAERFYTDFHATAPAQSRATE